MNMSAMGFFHHITQPRAGPGLFHHNTVHSEAVSRPTTGHHPLSQEAKTQLSSRFGPSIAGENDKLSSGVLFVCRARAETPLGGMVNTSPSSDPKTSQSQQAMHLRGHPAVSPRLKAMKEIAVKMNVLQLARNKAWPLSPLRRAPATTDTVPFGCQICSFNSFL